MNQDNELLRRFADQDSQEAFAELVRRKVDLVFAAALRQTGGDAHLAQDVTQGVFVFLARRAGSLAGHAMLSGWLFTTTRFLAIRAMRQQRRWQRREQEANAMNARADQTEPAWKELRPVIDEALHELDARDRDPLVLRFFEGRSLAEVGAAVGLAENSARMRVERALDKLRARLARRGITSTVAALGATLAAQPAVSAPVGLAGGVTGSALAGAAATLPLIELMSIKKIILGVAALSLVGTGAYLSGSHQAAAQVARREAEPATLRAQNQKLESTVQQSSRTLEAIAPAAVGRPANASAPIGVFPWIAELQRRKIVTFSVATVNANGRLAPAFGEFFGLTSDEQSALQRRIDGACERLAALDRANAVVARDERGNVVIDVNPFPTEGGAIYDELMKSFADILGPERNAAFANMAASQYFFERTLGHIGTVQRTITYSFNPTIPEGGKRFSVKMTYKTPGGGDNGESNGSFASLGEALDYAGLFGRLVPPDFGH